MLAMIPEAFDELEGLLTDLDFLQMEVDAGLVYDLIDAFDKVLGVLPRERALRNTLALLREGLGRDVHFIARHPKSLFQCLWNTCWWYDCPQAKGFYDPPELGWPDCSPPWDQPAPRLHTLLENWREMKGQRTPGHVWIRTLHPPIVPLRGPQPLTLVGHTDKVFQVATSKDGNLIATGSADRTVRIWDASSGREELSLSPMPTDYLRELSFAPDSSRVAGVFRDGTVQVWDLASRSEAFRIPGSGGDTHVAAFSRDRWLVAVGQETTGLVTLYDLCAEQELQSFQVRAGVACLALSARGDALAIGMDDDTVMFVGSCFLTGRPERVGGILVYYTRVVSLAVAPNGVLVAGAVPDGVAVWDISNGTRLAFLKGLPNFILTVAFSADSTRVCAGGDDGSVAVWEVEQARLIARLRGHADAVQDLAFTMDNDLLLSASSDRSVRIWDLRATGRTGSARHRSPSLHTLSMSDDSTRVVGGQAGVRVTDRYPVDGDDRCAVVLETATGRAQAVLTGHVGPVMSAVLSPDGRTVATGSLDATIRLWDPENGAQLVCLRGHSAGVLSLAFSADGLRIASGHFGGTVILWDLATHGMVARYTGQDYEILSLAFSDNGKRIASGCIDGSVCVWDANIDERRRCTCIRRPEFCWHHGGPVRDLAFCRRDRIVAAASRPECILEAGMMEHAITIWDTRRGDSPCVIKEPGALSYSRRLAMVVAGRRCLVWKVNTPRGEMELRKPGTREAVAWFPAVFVQVANPLAGNVCSALPWQPDGQTVPFYAMVIELDD
jgi:WD40 repeat protein